MYLALMEFLGLLTGAILALLILLIVIKFFGKLKSVIFGAMVILFISITLRYLFGGDFWSSFFIGSQTASVTLVITFWTRH